MRRDDNDGTVVFGRLSRPTSPTCQRSAHRHGAHPACAKNTGPCAFTYDPTRGPSVTTKNYQQNLCQKSRVNKAKHTPVGTSSYYRYKSALKEFHPRTHPSHKVMTPAYATNSISISSSSSAGATPSYVAQSRNATRSVIYTPYYNCEQQYQFQLGDWKNDSYDSGKPFVATSPTSPKYTPTSPSFVSNYSQHSQDGTFSPYNEGAFSPCYEPQGEVQMNKCSNITSVDCHVEMRSDNETSTKQLSSSSNPLLCDPSSNSSSISSDSNSNSSKSRPSRSCGVISIKQERKETIVNDTVPADSSNTNGTKEVQRNDDSLPLEYDPLQPQYSLTYEPDPAHLFNEKEYNPLFPALND
eukprot:CAMPEP_0183767494 /NCGR_PEP_ID=MMETSP0739-20130205/12220_1 /TAXON_ID=385413 /ORGANISM="Thalassiosira miniscula, Strain CCMP1093" /LENGTH=354 /DNA_ID=CAMNT_0026006399 /DNA_START=71 /DNA_END=1135 /DNA_ORIENTATION=-